jgi:uncharacterized membrane protein required for colicin V production
MTEFLAELSWIDLVVVAILAVGVFLGWMQGFIRHALNGVGVIVAFVLASQLKGPVNELLVFWEILNPPLKELWVYLVLFVVLTLAAWFVVRALFGRRRLPVAKVIDEIGGAVMGALLVVLSLVLLLVSMDTFFGDPLIQPAAKVEAGWLKGLYDTLNGSFLVRLFHETVSPVLSFFLGPFVPPETAEAFHR